MAQRIIITGVTRGLRPEKISMVDLLRWFWESHDPTQGDRQGNDRGTQYRDSPAGKTIHFSMDPMIFRHRCGKTMKDIHKHLAAMFFITRSIVGKFLVDGSWGWDNLIAGGYEIPALWFNGWVSCGFVKKNMWKQWWPWSMPQVSPFAGCSDVQGLSWIGSGGLQSVVSGLGGGSMGCF